MDEEKLRAAYEERVAQIAKSLNYRTGTNQIGANLATINVPESFRFLDAADAKKVLVDIWGNPNAGGVLGMIVPVTPLPSEPESWGAVITFDEDGYVSDKEADKINYNDLLKQMKEDTAAANVEREKQGYEPVQLIGWAAPPRYDEATHQLYWAKELAFGNAGERTLNYNIRLLGRRGVLNVNVVGGMNQLSQVEQIIPQILSSTSFNPGNQYADFNPATDKVAEYGMAALVVGGVAAAATKGGILKGLIAALIAGKKFVIIAVIAIGAWISKVALGKRRDSGAV